MELDVIELAPILRIARTEFQVPVVVQAILQMPENAQGVVPHALVCEEGRRPGRKIGIPDDRYLVRHELEKKSFLRQTFHIVVEHEVVLLHEQCVTAIPTV